VFESRLIAVTGTVTNLVMSNNSEQCPRCGAMAALPDGTFNVFGDTVEVLAATPLTRERLLRLSLILEQACSGTMPEADVAAAVERDDPRLAELLRRLPPRMRHAFILILFAAIQILAGTELGKLTGDAATHAELQQDVQRLEQEIRAENVVTRTAIQQAVATAVERYEREQARH
jgi:hypothetical protein